MRGLLAITLCLAAWVVGCEPSPPPQNASAFLARRKMAKKLVVVAEDAHRQDDPAKEAATYRLLIELWPDLPEAKTGGVWHDEAREAERVLTYQRSLSSTRRQGLTIEERLRLSENRLDDLKGELDRVLQPTVEESSAPTLENDVGVLRGASVGVAIGSAP